MLKLHTTQITNAQRIERHRFFRGYKRSGQSICKLMNSHMVKSASSVFFAGPLCGKKNLLWKYFMHRKQIYNLFCIAFSSISFTELTTKHSKNISWSLVSKKMPKTEAQDIFCNFVQVCGRSPCVCVLSSYMHYAYLSRKDMHC